MIECVDCGGQFFGHECFANHKRAGSYKKNNKKVCEVVCLCENCTKVVNVYQPKHECGIGFCRACKKRHGFNDLCFMRPGSVDTRGKKYKYLYIFYDFETRQDTPYGESARIHVLNLCVAHQVCTHCIDIDEIQIVCGTCGVREFVFYPKSTPALYHGIVPSLDQLSSTVDFAFFLDQLSTTIDFFPFSLDQLSSTSIFPFFLDQLPTTVESTLSA